MTFSSFHAKCDEKKKKKRKNFWSRERERETWPELKREIFFLLSLKRHAQKVHASRHNTEFFLLRFNDTHLRHTFCFREPARERER